MCYSSCSIIIILQVYNPDDSSKNSNATITFYLTDVNDNPPYFTNILNDTCLYENATAGEIVSICDTDI